MLIEVISGSNDVKEIRSPKDQSIVAIKQTVYAHIPNSAFPVQVQVRVERPLQPGKYEMELVYKTGRFGDLEIDPFKTPSIKPASPAQVKTA